MQRGQILLGRRWCSIAAAEDIAGALEQLLLPVGDLVRVNIELLGQFGQRLLFSSRSAANATRALNSGEWPRFCPRVIFMRPFWRHQGASAYLAGCPVFRDHLCLDAGLMFSPQSGEQPVD